MQTCDCHPVEMFEDGVLPKGWKCPLSGLKAVSVAQGGLDNFIEEAATMAHSMFMASLPLATSEEMRHYLGQQFFYAKSSIQVQCLVRSRPFRSLPATLLTLGCENDDEALTGGAQCIMEWCALGPAEQRNAHPKTKEMMEEGAFLDDLLKCMEDEQIGEDGEVATWRYKSLFAGILEVSIEGRHAQLNKDIAKAPHHNVGFCSCKGRKWELQDLISTAEGSAELTTQLTTCYSSSRCLEALGMQCHPSLAPFWETREGKHRCLAPGVSDRIAQNVVYNLDPDTQFQDLPDPFQGNDDGDGGCGQPPADGGDGAGNDDKHAGDDETSSTHSDSSTDSDSSGGGAGGQDGKGSKKDGSKKVGLEQQLLKQNLYQHWLHHIDYESVYSCQLTAPDFQQCFGGPSMLLASVRPRLAVTEKLEKTMGTRPGLAKYATLALERSKARSHQEDEATEDAGMSEKKGICKGIFAKQHPQILKSMHVFWRVAHRNPAACEDKFGHDSKVVYGAHDVVLQMLCAVASKKDTQEILLAQDGEHCVVDMQKMISSGKGFLVWDRTVTRHHFSPLMFDVAGSDPIEVWNMASELGSLVSRQQLMVQNITRNCNLQVPASDKVRQHSLERLQEAGLAHVISRSGTFAS